MKKIVYILAFLLALLITSCGETWVEIFVYNDTDSDIIAKIEKSTTVSSGDSKQTIITEVHKPETVEPDGHIRLNEKSGRYRITVNVPGSSTIYYYPKDLSFSSMDGRLEFSYNGDNVVKR